MEESEIVCDPLISGFACNVTANGVAWTPQPTAQQGKTVVIRSPDRDVPVDLIYELIWTTVTLRLRHSAALVNAIELGMASEGTCGARGNTFMAKLVSEFLYFELTLESLSLELPKFVAILCNGDATAVQSGAKLSLNVSSFCKTKTEPLLIRFNIGAQAPPKRQKRGQSSYVRFADRNWLKLPASLRVDQRACMLVRLFRQAEDSQPRQWSLSDVLQVVVPTLLEVVRHDKGMRTIRTAEMSWETFDQEVKQHYLEQHERIQQIINEWNGLGVFGTIDMSTL